MLSEVMATRRLTRREKQEQTREAILRSASTLFARQGVEGTSMEEIARHAGLTQGAIYSNFKSKADLWWAIGEQITRTLSFEDFVTGDRSVREEFRAAGAAAARLLRDVPKTHLLLDHEFNLFLMRHPKLHARFLGDFQEGQREDGAQFEALAASRGTRLPMSGERLALLTYVLARGLLHLQALRPDLIDEDFCAEAFALLAGCEEASQRLPGKAAGSSRRRARAPRRPSNRARRAPA
jgi:AcrR family transcriptional regulator